MKQLYFIGDSAKRLRTFSKDARQGCPIKNNI